MNKLGTNTNPCSCGPAVVTTQTIEGIKGLANCFVHVLSNNTTYYVSSCHEITVIFSGPVFVDDYDYATNPLNIRAQEVYDFANNRMIVFNELGQARLVELKEAD